MASKTLYFVETVCPEDRDEECVSSPFSQEKKAEEYAASLVYDHVAKIYSAAPDTARLIHQMLHEGNWIGAVEAWNDYAEDTNDNLPRYNINEDWLNRDVLRTPLKVSAPTPTQDDINEAITIQSYEAYYARELIVDAKNKRQLYRQLSKLREDLCSPRIFEVSDHGNVTEFSYTGRVIGEWV